MLLVGQQF